MLRGELEMMSRGEQRALENRLCHWTASRARVNPSKLQCQMRRVKEGSPSIYMVMQAEDRETKDKAVIAWNEAGGHTYQRWGDSTVLGVKKVEDVEKGSKMRPGDKERMWAEQDARRLATPAPTYGSKCGSGHRCGQAASQKRAGAPCPRLDCLVRNMLQKVSHHQLPRALALDPFKQLDELLSMGLLLAVERLLLIVCVVGELVAVGLFGAGRKERRTVAYLRDAGILRHRLRVPFVSRRRVRCD